MAKKQNRPKKSTPKTGRSRTGGKGSQKNARTKNPPPPKESGGGKG
jgi:hypothetical protein